MDPIALRPTPEGMGRYVVSFPNGLVPFSFIAPSETPLGLKRIQQMVGGNIEWIISPVFDVKPDYTIFGYEDARVFAKRENKIITKFLEGVYGYSQVGTFVIGSDNEHGETVAMSHDQCVMLEDKLGPISWIDHTMSTWELTAAVLAS